MDSGVTGAGRGTSAKREGHPPKRMAFPFETQVPSYLAATSGCVVSEPSAYPLAMSVIGMGL
jgi:hypothetical protein